jgi:hypothetical protein
MAAFATLARRRGSTKEGVPGSGNLRLLWRWISWREGWSMILVVWRWVTKLTRWFFREESELGEVVRTVVEGVGTVRWFGSMSM